MKKFIISLCLLCGLLLCACGGDDTVSAPGTDISKAVSQQESSLPGEISAPEESREDEVSAPEDISLPGTLDDVYEGIIVDATGYFVSDYGCGVDIEVRWSLRSTDSGKVLLTADVLLYSYSIKVGARYNDCKLTINDEPVYFSTDAVDTEYATREYTLLATVERELELSSACHVYDITVSFPFRGTYNGVSLPAIEATACLTVNTDSTVEY